MRLIGLILILVAFVCAKPMESIERYNIILVHGAADSLSGVDCEASDLKAPFVNPANTPIMNTDFIPGAAYSALWRLASVIPFER